MKYMTKVLRYEKLNLSTKNINKNENISLYEYINSSTLQMY